MTDVDGIALSHTHQLLQVSLSTVPVDEDAFAIVRVPPEKVSDLNLVGMLCRPLADYIERVACVTGDHFHRSITQTCCYVDATFESSHS